MFKERLGIRRKEIHEECEGSPLSSEKLPVLQRYPVRNGEYAKSKKKEMILNEVDEGFLHI